MSDPNGLWIQLTSGGGYDFEKKEIFGPFQLREDLAWPLGCPRFTRHTYRPWSIALHSVAVARAILKVTGSKIKAAAGLLHDGHEAVIGDITTPVARHIGKDRVDELKDNVDIAIFQRLGIPQTLLAKFHPEIKLADAAAVHVERALFQKPEPRAWSVIIPPHEWMIAMYDATLDLAHIPPVMSYDGVDDFLMEYEDLVQPLVREAKDPMAAYRTGAEGVRW